MLLKEYPPGTRRLAWKELEIAAHLQGGFPAPEGKWKAATSDPVVR